MRGLLALLALGLLGAAAPGIAPSFSCAGNLSASEQAICSDPELSAWDRAIAMLYTIGIRGELITSAQQRDWLNSREACGADKRCLRRAHQDWPGYSGTGFGLGQDYVRSSKTDDANLNIAPVAGGWYAFSIEAIHIVTNRRGQFVTANEGEAHGVVLITAGKGHFSSDPGDEFSCEIDFTRRKSGWLLTDNGQCGGVNVTMTGNYALKRGAKRM